MFASLRLFSFVQEDTSFVFLQHAMELESYLRGRRVYKFHGTFWRTRKLSVCEQYTSFFDHFRRSCSWILIIARHLEKSSPFLHLVVSCCRISLASVVVIADLFFLQGSQKPPLSTYNLLHLWVKMPHRQQRVNFMQTKSLQFCVLNAPFVTSWIVLHWVHEQLTESWCCVSNCFDWSLQETHLQQIVLTLVFGLILTRSSFSVLLWMSEN